MKNKIITVNTVTIYDIILSLLNIKPEPFIHAMDEEEIYISGKHTYNALNEDEVLVEIIDESDAQSHKEGKISKRYRSLKVFSQNHTSLFVIIGKLINDGY